MDKDIVVLFFLPPKIPLFLPLSSTHSNPDPLKLIRAANKFQTAIRVANILSAPELSWHLICL